MYVCPESINTLRVVGLVEFDLESVEISCERQLLLFDAGSGLTNTGPIAVIANELVAGSEEGNPPTISSLEPPRATGGGFGEVGGSGRNGNPGEPGSNGRNSKCSTNPFKKNRGARHGAPGTHGAGGDDGKPGGRGQDGSDGGRGSEVDIVVLSRVAGKFRLEARGGDGGWGGNGGNGGNGGRGGDGGAGGKGGNAEGFPCTYPAKRGGKGARAGDGGHGADGGEGGSGGNGGPGGRVTVLAPGSDALDHFDIRNDGGFGGLGGAGGYPGKAGMPGEPGRGGRGGNSSSVRSAGSRGAHASTSSVGEPGSRGSPGNVGAHGESGRLTLNGRTVVRRRSGTEPTNRTRPHDDAGVEMIARSGASGLQLGSGVDLLAGYQPRQPCMTFDQGAVVRDMEEGHVEDSVQDVLIAFDSRELDFRSSSSFAVQGSVDYAGWGTTGRLMSQRSDRRRHSLRSFASSLQVVLSARASYGQTHIPTTAHLPAELATLSEDDEFRQMCGTHYVAAVRRESRLDYVMEVTNLDETEANALATLAKTAASVRHRDPVTRSGGGVQIETESALSQFKRVAQQAGSLQTRISRFGLPNAWRFRSMRSRSSVALRTCSKNSPPALAGPPAPSSATS